LIRINSRTGWMGYWRMMRSKEQAMTARPMRSLLAGAASALLVACAPQKTSATNGDAVALIDDGRAIAEEQCGRCHAPGTEGASPRADAPPFRTILSRYRADTLTEELISGIKLGHPDMPLFELNPQGVDDLVAYLKSIQEPTAPNSAPDPR
jgi:mono/diheme cytochrome c family protein